MTEASWKEFPFDGGQRDDTESRLLPEGALAKVRNLRQLKNGRWGKRLRYNNITLTSKHTGSDAAVPDNSLLSLAALNQDRLILGGTPCKLYNYAEDRARVVPYDPDISNQTWEVPTFAAPDQTIVETQAGIIQQKCDSASRNDYTVVACLDQNDDLVAHVYSEPDGIHLYDQTLASAAYTTNVQCVAVGNEIIVFWTESTTTADGTYTLKFDVLSAVNQTGINKFSGTPTTVGTLYDYTSIPAVQARLDETSTARLVIVWHSDLEEITCEQWASPWSAAAVSETITPNPGAVMINAVVSESTGHSWVAWVNPGQQEVAFSHGDEDFGSLTAPALIDSGDTYFNQPIITKDTTAARALVAWNVAGASGEYGIRQSYLTTGPDAASTPDDFWGWQLASQFLRAADMPAGYSSGVDHFALASPQRNSDALTKRSYYLLRFNLSSLTTTLRNSGIVQARLAENQVGATQWSNSLPHIHETSSDDFLLAQVHTPAQLGVTVSAWRLRATGYDRGHAVAFGGGLYYPAGCAWRWDGVQPRLAGFPEPPEIISLTAGTAGVMTQGATYGYLCVLEREEHDGSLTLSTPSEPATIELAGAEDSVALDIRADRTVAGFTRVRIYRTLANGSVYHHLTTVDAGRGWLDEGPTEYTDTAGDASTELGHVVYTQVGNVLGNDPMPACKYISRAGLRLVTAGHEEANRVRFSKNLFFGESASFPAAEEYSVTVTEPVRGLGALDATPIVFGARTITLVLGTGPDDAGIGLFETRELPCNSGLVAWGHRTIAECTHGLVYQAPEGIHLIPRGFGPPVFIGAPVRDVLLAYPYVTSAVVDAEAQELRMTATDDLDSPTAGVLLVWDLRTQAWIISDVDADGTPFVCAASWGGTHVLGAEDLPGGLYEEGTVTLLSEHFESHIETGDIRPGAVSRFGRCRQVQFTGEWRASCSFKIELSTDGGQTWPKSKTFDLNNAFISAGGTLELRWHLPLQKATRFRLRFTDLAKAGGAGSEGVIYLGMSLDLRPKSLGARPGANRRG